MDADYVRKWRRRIQEENFKKRNAHPYKDEDDMNETEEKE